MSGEQLTEETAPSTKVTESIVTISPSDDPPNLDIEIIDADDDQPLESNVHEQLESTRNKLVEAEERADRFETMHKECMANAPADFLSCMKLLLPEVTAPGVNVTEFMVNILQDVQFAKAMEQHWADFHQFLKQGSHAKLPNKVKKVYHELEKTIKAKWNEFARFAENEMPGAGKAGREGFQTVFNKTKETVSQLSEKVHNTWHKVKNLSSDILREHRALGDIKASVERKVSSMGRNVKKGWDAVKEHVPGGWFRKKKPAEESKKYEGHPQDHLGNSPFLQEQTQDVSLEELAKADSRGYNNKGNKQTQSMSLEQKYEEFWKRANYDPDDYVAEDFFQGNQREWKKQQKRFKKLHGRIHRLNEDMLYSMDDDDIEDMYEDLDDFEDDVNLEEQPTKLKDWLTCQIRWWKSRFQRKHRNEDFVKGCDAQLMRWQLRAMCKPLCQGKKCKKRATTNVHACQALYAQTVIADSVCEQSKDNGETNETIVGDFTMEPGVPAPGNLFTMDKAEKERNFILLEPHTPDTGDHSTEWVWERYHTREYQRQEKPGWQFKRATSRAFEREKPWYYKRADQRRKMWSERQDKY